MTEATTAVGGFAPPTAGRAICRPARLLGIDAVRCIAFLAVLLIHSVDRIHFEPPGPLLGVDQCIDQSARFAVPFFFIVSGYFLRPRAGGSLGERILGVLRRLCPVYVFWVLVENALDPQAWTARIDAGFLLRLAVQGGVTPHLWFLSSLAFCLVLALMAERHLSPRITAAVAVGLYGATLACGPYGPLLFRHAPSLAAYHAVRDAGGFGFLFVILGCRLRESDWRPSMPVAGLVFLFGAALYGAEAWSLTEVESVRLASHEVLVGTVPFGLGCMLLALAWTGPTAIARRLAAFGQISLGLYALHPLFVFFMGEILRPRSLPERLGIASLAGFATLAVVSALARVPQLRPLVR